MEPRVSNMSLLSAFAHCLVSMFSWEVHQLKGDGSFLGPEPSSFSVSGNRTRQWRISRLVSNIFHQKEFP